MVAHVVATFSEEPPQTTETTIPASMVAHVVQVVPESTGK